MSKIYLACALTHVPRSIFFDYCMNIHELAIKLESKGHVVKYALKNSDPQLSKENEERKPDLCYIWDKALIEEAEYVIADASFPSLGLGIELQIAANYAIPVILIYKYYSINKAEQVKYINPDGAEHCLQIGEGKISLMALGLPNIHSVYYYNTLEDISQNIIDDLTKT